MADVNFGVKQIKLAPATGDGSYPDFDTEGILIPMIVIDSFTYDKEDDQTQDILWGISMMWVLFFRVRRVNVR